MNLLNILFFLLIPLYLGNLIFMQLSKKIAKSVEIISKFRHYVTTDILISIYYSLVYGDLIHGIEIWGLTYATYLKPISLIQKKAISIMSFSDPRSHSQPIFKSLHIVKFDDLIKYRILKFVFHWKRELVPCSLFL